MTIRLKSAQEIKGIAEAGKILAKILPASAIDSISFGDFKGIVILFFEKVLCSSIALNCYDIS